MRKLSVLLLLFVLSITLLAQIPPAAQSAMKTIDGERIRAHVKFLSSDLLEGRGTGQRGGDLAADYIATQFALLGLKPAGDNGSYWQKVPMVGIKTAPETAISFAFDKGQPLNLKLADDVVAVDQSQQPASPIDAPIVFVGYGIDAPEYQWNDFKGVDVRGKIVLMLVNEPPSDDPKFFKGKALTYYGRWTYKYEQAARLGAVGVLLVHKTEMASYPWTVVRNSWSGENAYLRGDSDPKLHLAGWITYDVANKLAASINSDVEKLIASANSRDFRPVPLPVRVKGKVVSKVRPFDSENVIGMLEGSDPKLKSEAVIYSAHWDHFGIHPDEPAPNIYHGAVDNATGCGVLIEMAHAFATAPQRPKRSIIFAAVTAEEQGLRGSEFLGKHPPVPANKVALGLNFDALAPIGVPESIVVSGAERTTFYPVVERTAQEMHFTIEPDSNPGAGGYFRSDHFSLARVGVPAFSVNQGAKFEGRTREWVKAYRKEFTAKHYHQPSDEYHADWDFHGDARMAQLGVALGWQAADSAQSIGWVKGDEFDRARTGAGK